MGLLRLAGADVGKPSRLAGPAAMNPKGFLELKSQNILLEVAYPGIYPDVVSPPEPTVLQAIGKQHASAYRQFLAVEFENVPLAIKAPCCLTLPMFHELREELDVRVIMMHRCIDDVLMIRSLLSCACGPSRQMLRNVTLPHAS
jgi:hypothetical protein